MTHSNITLNIQSRRSSEPESLHISVNLSFEYSAVTPRSSEPRNQLIVYRTSELVDQLNTLGRTVMCIAEIPKKYQMFNIAYTFSEFLFTYQSFTTISKPSVNK